MVEFVAVRTYERLNRCYFLIHAIEVMLSETPDTANFLCD